MTRYRNTVLLVFCSINMSACMKEPCDESALEVYKNKMTHLTPKFNQLKEEEKVNVMTMLRDLNKKQNLPTNELCVLVKELVQEMEVALQQ